MAPSHQSSSAQCPNLPGSDAQVIIDPDGDLRLRVGTTECVSSEPDHEHRTATVFVCESKTLSRASPVWKAMLYGPWRESRDSNNPAQGEWVVELPDDKPEPMAMVLNIIHSRFETLPDVQSKDSIPELYELAVLSDKYDLAKVFRPWAETWLKPLRDQYPEDWILSREKQDPS